MAIWEKRNEINFIHEMKPEKYSRYEQTIFFRPIGLDKVFFYGNLSLFNIKKCRKKGIFSFCKLLFISNFMLIKQTRTS